MKNKDFMKKKVGKTLAFLLSIVMLSVTSIPFTLFANAEEHLPANVSAYREYIYEYIENTIGDEYEEAQTDEFSYRSYKSGYAVIYGYAKNRKALKELHFPSEINGQKVIQVDFCYPEHRCGGVGETTIERIVFDEGIEVVGNFSKLCALEEVVFPSTLKFILDFAFYQDKNLKTAVFPENLEYVGQQAFDSTDITAEKLKIGKKLWISTGDDCGYPLSFEPKSGIAAYEVDEENPYFKSVDGVLYDKNEKTLFAYPSMKKDKSYNVPETTKRIWSYAFSGAKYLENVDVTGVLFTRVFAYCKKLKNVTLEKGTGSVISEGNFDGCEKLKKITLKDSNVKIKAEPFYYGINWDNVSVSGNERVCGVRVLKNEKNSLTIKWEPVAKAKKYEIKISLDGGKTWKKKAEVKGDSTKITGLNPGEQIRIKIRGINGNKKYGYSQVYAFTTKPETPKILKAYPVNDGTAICLRADGLIEDNGIDRYRIIVTVATDENFENIVKPSRVWRSGKDNRVHIYLPEGTYYIKIKNVRSKEPMHSVYDTDYRGDNAYLEGNFSKAVKVTL